MALGATRKVRVSCIGNSIAYGTGLDNPQRDSSTAEHPGRRAPLLRRPAPAHLRDCRARRRVPSRPGRNHRQPSPSQQQASQTSPIRALRLAALHPRQPHQRRRPPRQHVPKRVKEGLPRNRKKIGTKSYARKRPSALQII